MATQSKTKSWNIKEAILEAIGKGQSVISGLHKQAAQAELEVSRKNWILNGDMQVSQRGDFTTDGTNGLSLNDYTVDRWYFNNNNAGVDFFQHSTVTLSSGEAVNAVKMTVKSTADKYRRIVQKVEDYSTLSGKTITASFWYRAVNTSGKLHFSTYEDAAVGQMVAMSGASEFIKFSHTFSATELTSVFAFQVGFHDADGSAAAGVVGDYIEFTNVKLEIGSTATPFESRSYAEELALCQRYCLVFDTSGDNYSMFGATHWNSSTVGIMHLELPVEMYTVASQTISGTFTYTLSSRATDSTTKIASINTTSSGKTVGYSNFVRAENDASAYILLEAEL